EPGPEAEGPEGLGLEVRPNPFRGEAQVTLSLSRPAEVEAALYDVLGRRVALLAPRTGSSTSGRFPAGHHELPLDAGRLPAGVYVVRVTAGGAVATTTVTLLR
ncbi:MAG TPA: T9SS type A sorting domain-containing protein, partial [Rubricoccaceae bacterium]|nr:T9SS type A sorting domain-containing protein [Rubricoccaceae bacterium]